MTYAVGRDAQLLVNQYNLTGYLKGYDPEVEVNLEDSTVLGDAGRKSWPGLTSGGIGFDFIYEKSAGSAFDLLRSQLQAATQSIVTAFPEGSTLGFPCDLCYALPGRMSAPVKVGSLQVGTGYFKSERAGVEFGVSLHALGAETGNVNSTSVDNGAATTNGGVAHLHETATGGTLSDGVFKVQHSADNSTWADLLQFSRSADDGVGAERVEVAAGTTVNRYLRAVLTSFSGSGGPSVTYAIAFARR